MNLSHRLCTPFLVALCTTMLPAQTPQPIASTTTAVPRLIRINSTFRPANGGTPDTVESASLSIYGMETGGTPLWQETQNVAIDGDGHYSTLLGSLSSEGLPLELFASGEPRWVGVHFQRPGESEQPRMRLASVPYALKAADAETLGGRPASSYVLNGSADASDAEANASAASSAAVSVNRRAMKSSPRFISAGTTSSIAVFTDAAGDIANSVMYQNGTKVGLGTTNPRDYVHVAFNDGTGGFTGYAVQNMNGGPTAYSGMLFYDQLGALAAPGDCAGNTRSRLRPHLSRVPRLACKTPT